MSKKYSTFKTESENNFECDSPSTSNCNSANSKSSISVHLSNAEDAQPGTSNNNTFVHQVLTSNSNSHSNIAIETLTNDRSYNTSHTSFSSLEEDLYATSESFKKNLNSIKEKLQKFGVISPGRNNFNQSSSRSGTSENDNAYSANSEGNSSDPDKPKGYLSSRSALFNLDEYTISEKYNSGASTSYHSCFSHLPVTPTDELPALKLEVIQEVEEEHYEVPNKKLCFRAFTPRFERFNAILQKFDINLNKEDDTDSAEETKTLHKNVSNSSSTKSSKPSTSKTLVSNISAFGADSSSSKKCKYANFVTQDDDNLNATNSNQTIAEEEICSNNSTPSINSPSKSTQNFINKNFNKVIQKMESENIKSESPENVSNNETFDLHLNLPSSIVDDSSSYKKSPLEPKIIVLKEYEGKRRKKYLKNKVHPDLESQGLESSDSSSSSISNVNEMTLLYQRYYETTPELSSRTNSSPSCILSTSNPSPSLKSKSETQHRTNLSPRSSAPSSPHSSISKNNTIDPSLIASLDVPKIGQQNLDFPSITKITTFPDVFYNQACKGDAADVQSYNHKSEKSDNITQVQVHYSCYRETAKVLINSPTVSPARQVNHGYGDLRPPNREILECPHFNENSIRKTQSSKIAFYQLPSAYDSSEELTNKCITVDTTHRTIPQDISVEKKCKKCCCFVFFSKGNRRFF